MPFTLPTLAQLRRFIRDDIAAHLPGADATIPNSNLRVMSDAQAGLTQELVLFLRWLSQQLLPDTAETEWLERHADLWLKAGRKEATFASGSVTMTGVAGTVVPALTRLTGNNQVEYQTTADIVLGSDPVEVAVEALDAGAVGNVVEGGRLSLVEAIPGVNGQAVVVTMEGGLEAENDERLRERVLARIKAPPHGGAAGDYVQWAMEVPGVTRAWCIPNGMGIGTILLFVMFDDIFAGNQGIPDGAALIPVREYIDTVRPVAIKDCFVEAPTPVALDVTIRNLDLDTLAVRASIEDELRRMLLIRASPGQTIYASWIGEAVSRALGEISHNLDTANLVMPSAGHIAVLGNITYA